MLVRGLLAAASGLEGVMPAMLRPNPAAAGVDVRLVTLAATAAAADGLLVVG